MAGPQKENGYTPIANEILEAIAKITLSPTGYKILFVVWRQTYGFNRCQHSLSDSFIAKATDTHSKLINREINRLIDRKILTLYKQGTYTEPRQIGFNKDYDTWASDYQPKEGYQRNSRYQLNGRQGTNETVDRVPTKQLPKEIQSKDNKESIYSLSVQKVFSIWNDQKIITHGFTEDINKAISAAIKKYGVDEVVLGIQRYSKIYHDPDFFFDYKWTLVNFLSRKKGLSDFLDGGEKWENYLARGQPKAKSKVPVDALGDPVPGGQDMTPI